MSDQQEVQRQIALRLRDMASRFLGSAAGIDDPELRRKLTQWAFELVRDAVALEPIEDQAEPGSLSPSGAPNPAAHAAVPVPRRRNSRSMATRAIVKPQPVRPTAPGAGAVLQTSGANAFPQVSERHVRLGCGNTSDAIKPNAIAILPISRTMSSSHSSGNVAGAVVSCSIFTAWPTGLDVSMVIPLCS